MPNWVLLNTTKVGSALYPAGTAIDDGLPGGASEKALVAAAGGAWADASPAAIAASEKALRAHLRGVSDASPDLLMIANAFAGQNQPPSVAWIGTIGPGGLITPLAQVNAVPSIGGPGNSLLTFTFGTQFPTPFYFWLLQYRRIDLPLAPDLFAIADRQPAFCQFAVIDTPSGTPRDLTTITFEVILLVLGGGS